MRRLDEREQFRVEPLILRQAQQLLEGCQGNCVVRAIGCSPELLKLGKARFPTRRPEVGIDPAQEVPKCSAAFLHGSYLRPLLGKLEPPG